MEAREVGPVFVTFGTISPKVRVFPPKCKRGLQLFFSDDKQVEVNDLHFLGNIPYLKRSWILPCYHTKKKKGGQTNEKRVMRQINQFDMALIVWLLMTHSLIFCPWHSQLPACLASCLVPSLSLVLTPGGGLGVCPQAGRPQPSDTMSPNLAKPAGFNTTKGALEDPLCLRMWKRVW